MSLPVKHSVALLIRSGDSFLAVRRPDNDDELPGVWGLPAGSYRESETIEDLVARIGRDKLGVDVKPVKKLSSGTQVRRHYVLEMELWEASMSELPELSTWRWATAEILEAGKQRGSLCCELAQGVCRREGFSG